MPGFRSEKQKAARIARWVPAMGFAYVSGCVLLFSLWSSARAKDGALGNTWETPLLGNYSLRITGVPDQGMIFDRTDHDVASQGRVESAMGRRNAIVGVQQLEVRAPYVLGVASANAFQEQPAASPKPLFFILDTRTGIRSDEASLAALQSSALSLGSPLKLSTVKDVYRRYRYDELDLIPLFAFFIPPIAGSWLLVRWFRRPRGKDTGAAPMGTKSGVQIRSTGAMPRIKVPPAGLFLCYTNGARRTPPNHYQHFRNLR
jgi:hypothetical protein